ncbi:MAG: zinc-binding dehydrogenase [Gammaproteobacteria bacterium]|nr:zinc-binding dehydrogenase [Gammaproteobacteria bacterium]
MKTEKMHAVYLKGHGGFEQLEYTDQAPKPIPKPDEVLVRVLACGMNNTDINTRTGWYNPSVKSGTADWTDAGVETGSNRMGGWSGDIKFPRIQGMDVAGVIEAVGDGIGPERVGQRVVCDPYLHSPGSENVLDSLGLLGAEFDGGFAQYLCLPAANALPVTQECRLKDSQLSTLPCSGGTAMNMLLLARVGRGDRLLVTGASGGVGSFLVQIGNLLGAEVMAVAAREKHAQLAGLGASDTIDRHAGNLTAAALSAGSGGGYSVVADVVGGDAFPAYLDMLNRGGRYVVAGAIAGPMVQLDLRTLYLKNLSFFGSTIYSRKTMLRLMEFANGNQLVPAVHREYDLRDIGEAQKFFLKKKHVGNLVLIPPSG